VVLDKTAGIPIRGVNITITDTYYGAMTDAAGRFILSTSMKPPFTLVVSREGYTQQTLAINEAGSQDVTVVLSKAGAKNRAAGMSAPEYQLKLVFIEKFIELTHWNQPKADTTPFVIGIYGQNPFGEDLFALEQKKIKNRPVEIRFFSTPDQIGAQDVLFVPKAPPTEVTEISTLLKAKPVLSICDAGMCADGGMMIGFVLIEDKIRFCLNKAAIAEAGFRVDPLLEGMALK
jgi:hypothetical protein